MTTGRDRYEQAIARARQRSAKLYEQFMAGHIDILPGSMDDERREVIAEMDEMQRQIDNK